MDSCQILLVPLLHVLHLPLLHVLRHDGCRLDAELPCRVDRLHVVLCHLEPLLWILHPSPRKSRYILLHPHQLITSTNLILSLTVELIIAIFGMAMCSESPDLVEVVLLGVPCGVDDVRAGRVSVWGHHDAHGQRRPR